MKPMRRSLFLLFLVPAFLAAPTMAAAAIKNAPIPKGWVLHAAANEKPTAAYRWLDVILEATAREVTRVGARPTIISRTVAIPVTAMYDAWAAYDATAVGTRLGGTLRRPEAERTEANQERAIAHAVYRTLVDMYPPDAVWLADGMRAAGYDPANTTTDPATPEGIGNLVAQALLDYRHHDGANQLGDEPGSVGKPYSDYTYYRPLNTPELAADPTTWQPIPFADGKGGTVNLGFLTPHWYRVKPFALESSAQFRSPPPPRVGSEQMQKEIEEVVRYNGSLTLEQKAIVEFMRDGPGSTGQSGHWLRFAQDVSRRDKNDLGRDVKLFFSVANVAFDAFIASWESKRYYDTGRPYWWVRHYYKGKTLAGWGGPGKGVVTLPAEQWMPYSPDVFVTPPFPGYTSGHSTVSAASARMLEHITGSDRYGAVARCVAGAITEPEFPPSVILASHGVSPKDAPMTCDVELMLPTFSATAEMAGLSRVMGGYHVQVDNVEGLALGGKVADFSWPRIQAYFDGTATVRN